MTTQFERMSRQEIKDAFYLGADKISKLVSGTNQVVWDVYGQIIEPERGKDPEQDLESLAAALFVARAEVEHLMKILNEQRP
jgi:hypothetical protein